MTNEIRKGSIVRKTKETDICIEVSLDGKGNADIDTGIGFFDHMLTALSVHSKISMSVHVKGDLHVDCHHTIEDTGIALGAALGQALGDKSGIVRYGTAYIPMDESLAMASLDHHKAEAVYKAVAHALKTAVSFNSDGSTLSTKGVL